MNSTSSITWLERDSGPKPAVEGAWVRIYSTRIAFSRELVAAAGGSDRVRLGLDRENHLAIVHSSERGYLLRAYPSRYVLNYRELAVRLLDVLDVSKGEPIQAHVDRAHDRVFLYASGHAERARELIEAGHYEAVGEESLPSSVD